MSKVTDKFLVLRKKERNCVVRWDPCLILCWVSWFGCKNVVLLGLYVYSLFISSEYWCPAFCMIVGLGRAGKW